jgi:transcriptional regulator with XRE-family HTH domain
VDTSLLRRFADYVRQAALAAGYDIDSPRGGDKTRLATDAGMSLTTLSRLLSAERMPDARYFAGLAKALKVNLSDLLVQSGIIPAESLTQAQHESVNSRPLTPDEVADSWQVDRDAVRAMYEFLRKTPRPVAEDDRDGRKEAQG